MANGPYPTPQPSNDSERRASLAVGRGVDKEPFPEAGLVSMSSFLALLALTQLVTETLN